MMRGFRATPSFLLAACVTFLCGCSQMGSTRSSTVDGDLPDTSGAVQSGPTPASGTLPLTAKPVVVASTGSSAVTQAPPAADLDSSFDNLELVDASLKGKLSVLRVGSQPTPTNLLAVFAGLKNKTSRKLSLQVQTIYKDRAQNPLNAGSWIDLTLKPHEETEYHSASISDQAVDFLVRIRRAPHAKASATPPPPPPGTP